MKETILILDFGGQYNMLIARRVREQHVYAEIRPYSSVSPDEIRAAGYRGVIFTGGPNSVTDPASPRFDPAILTLGVPILGICYGHQLLAWMAGGEIASAGSAGEYGRVELTRIDSPLFDGIPAKSVCWMSHTDAVRTAPAGFSLIASTGHCPCAAMADEDRRLYGVQFHPEVTHTAFGAQVLHNFLFKICGCAGDWTMDDFVTASVERYRRALEGKRALCALSGGVDSSVAAVLMHRAIGDRLTCVFVDHGLLRKGEGDTVERVFRERFDMKLIRVDARERFLQRLRGVTEPEQKRRIIGEEFIRVFEQEARKLGRIDVLVQGTIYPDVIESGAGDASVIKSHHNVGGLPEKIGLPLQGRGARGGPRARHPGGARHAPALPGAGARHPGFGGGHGGEARGPARGRRDFPRGGGEGRAFRRARPIFRGADRQPQRRRHGRREDLRLDRGPARGLHRRLHDRRLEPASV